MTTLDDIDRRIKERGWSIGEDYYEGAVIEYGDTKKTVIPDLAEIEKYRGRVPNSLLRIWTEHGWGSWQQGRFWFCDPAFLQPLVNTLLRGDPDFPPEKAVPFGYDGLGQLYIWVRNFRHTPPLQQILRIDPILNSADIKNSRGWNPVSYRPIGLEESFLYDFSDLLDYGDAFGAFIDEAEEDENMMPKLIERYGELQPGEIYGFFPAAVMGGSYSIENIQRTPLIAHLSFIFEMQQPILQEYIPPKEGELGFGHRRDIRLLGSPHPE